MTQEPTPPTQEESDFESFSSEEEEEEEDKHDETDEDEDGSLHSGEESEQEDKSDISMVGAQPDRKDPAEVELEKLVFGDSSGFRSALQDFQAQPPYTETESLQDDALATIPDFDLLPIVEEGASAALKPPPPASHELDRTDDSGTRAPPAWEDSDDERLRISLMSVPRLRKLRNYEGEDIISGKEYQRRLRRQYESLHPPPQWALWRPEPPSSHDKKRRKPTSTGSASSASDTDTDASMASTPSDTTLPPTLTNLLKTTRPLTRRTPAKLRNTSLPRLKPEVLGIDRLPDVVPSASSQPHATTSLSLHPTLPLLISGGISGMLYMHHLHPHPPPPSPPNPLITSLHMKHTPFTTVVFSPLSGTPHDPKIYMACARRSFHTWTLPTGAITKTTTTNMAVGADPSQRHVAVLKPSPCGRWLGVLGTAKKGGGVVNVLSAATLQWVAQARGEGRGGLADFCWWTDGEGMCLVGKTGECAEWSVGQRRVVGRWRDVGGIGVTVVVLGRDSEGGGKKKRKGRGIGPDRWAVVGTSSGIVTVYDRFAIRFGEEQGDGAGETSGDEASDHVATPQPHATLEHLTTAVSHLVVSPCGQMLAMASRWKRDALRLVHLQSGKVYRNWPTARTPLGRISSLVVGECEGIVQGEEGKGMVVVVGNEQGVIRNWVVNG